MKVTALFGAVLILAAFDLSCPKQTVVAMPVLGVQGTTSVTSNEPPQVIPSRFSRCFVQVPGKRGPVWVSSDIIPQTHIVNVTVSTGRISGTVWYTDINTALPK